MEQKFRQRDRIGWGLAFVGGLLLSDAHLNTWNGRFSGLIDYPWDYAAGFVFLVLAVWALLDVRGLPESSSFRGLARAGFSVLTTLVIVYGLLKVNHVLRLNLMTNMTATCNRLGDPPLRELCLGVTGMSFFYFVMPFVFYLAWEITGRVQQFVETHRGFNVMVRGRLLPLVALLTFFTTAHLYYLAKEVDFQDPLAVTPLLVSSGVFGVAFLSTRQPVVVKAVFCLGLAGVLWLATHPDIQPTL
jgi:hypothetical protein